MQWQNLIPLIDNALSSEDEQGNKGSLLVVGDPKQSIYRFRRADPRLFDDARQFLVTKLKAEPLYQNETRRNAPAINQAVNQIFLAGALPETYKYVETIRTDGGKRLYNVDKYLRERKCNNDNVCIENLDKLDELKGKLKLSYVRVSSHGQKDDLENLIYLIDEKEYPFNLLEILFNSIKFGSCRILKHFVTEFNNNIPDKLFANKTKIDISFLTKTSTCQSKVTMRNKVVWGNPKVIFTNDAWLKTLDGPATSHFHTVGPNMLWVREAWVEADMSKICKMENVLKAGTDGVVKNIKALERTAVEKGAILIEME